jgi:acetolactate synthase-1/3 small subunit
MIRDLSKAERYTLFVYSENHIGILGRITNAFTRRHININSLTVSESEVKGVYRYTLVTETD